MNSGEIRKADGEQQNLPATLRPEILSRHPAPVDSGLRVRVTAPRALNQFIHYWGVILDHKLLILAAFLVPLGIAAELAVMQRSLYRATTSLELVGVNQNFLNLKEIDPTTPLSSNSDRGDSYTQTQLELLKRDVLVERVARKLNLDQKADFVSHGSNLSSLSPGQDRKMSDRNDRVRAAVRTAQKKLKVQQLRQSNLVEISFQDSDPDLCVKFVNTLADEAVDENMLSRRALSLNVAAWLEQHLASLREKLNAEEHELQAFSAQSRLLPSSDKAPGDDLQLQRLEDQLTKAQTDRIHRESRYMIARSVDPDALPEVLDDPALKEFRVRLAELRRQQAELSASLTPDHPKVQRVRAEIADMQSTITEARSNILNRLHNEYSTAQREEQAVGAAYTAQASDVSATAQKEIHYNTLKRELETTRSMYEDVMKRVNDAELSSATFGGGMRIIDRATAPEKEDMLQTRMFIGGIGAFTGLLLAGLIVFVVDQANDTIKSPGHMPALLKVPELGIIPAMRVVGLNLLAPAPRTPIGALGSFHSVITSILFALDEGEGKRLIAVSSPGPGEGKTTVTANLGMVLSEVGHRVLLIDADVRMPSLHKMFGIKNGTGLTDILSDSKPISTPWIKTSLQRVMTNNTGTLDVLTGGERRIPAFSLLHSRRAGELFEAFRKDYDLILVDTAPLLLVPESRVIGRMTDWCILVFRAGKTTLDAALGSQQRMAEDGIPLLGTILNDCNPRQPSYSYYGDSTGALNG